jgi:hypothetical protein
VSVSGKSVADIIKWTGHTGLDLKGHPTIGNFYMSLKDEVETLLPNWESWYPSLFHAAEDLGIIRARVCSPSSLMLNNRHASVQSAGVNAFREKWGGNE